MSKKSGNFVNTRAFVINHVFQFAYIGMGASLLVCLGSPRAEPGAAAAGIVVSRHHGQGAGMESQRVKPTITIRAKSSWERYSAAKTGLIHTARLMPEMDRLFLCCPDFGQRRNLCGEACKWSVRLFGRNRSLQYLQKGK